MLGLVNRVVVERSGHDHAEVVDRFMGRKLIDVAEHCLDVFDAVIPALALAVSKDEPFQEIGVEADMGGPRNFSHTGRSLVADGGVVARRRG